MASRSTPYFSLRYPLRPRHLTILSVIRACSCVCFSVVMTVPSDIILDLRRLVQQIAMAIHTGGHLPLVSVSSVTCKRENQCACLRGYLGAGVRSK